MVKIINAMVILLIAAGTSAAQQLFEVQHPNPHANYIFDIHATDSLHALAVGNFSQVMETFDGGRSWKYQELDFPEKNEGSLFKDIIFIDSLHGWIAGSSFIMMHTADGGKSWQQQEIPQLKNMPGIFEQIYFLNRSEGWAVGYGQQNDLFNRTGGVIVHTRDGGETWQKVQPFDTVPPLHSIFFRDSLNGWSGGRNGFLLQTRNGGATWQKVVVTEIAGSYIYSMFSLSDSVTVLSTHNGRIYRTADDGATWTEFKNTGITTSMATRLHFSDSLRGIGYGVGGFYFTTEDGGASWQKVDLPGEILDEGYLAIFLPALSAPSDGSLWMAGNYGVVFRSNDGGKKWQRMTSFRDRLTGVRSTDDIHAWAFGNANTLLRTTDAGKNWTPLLKRDISRNIQDVFFLDNSNGWMVEAISKTKYISLFRTGDGGMTWNVIFADSLNALYSLRFFDKQNGIAAQIKNGSYSIIKTSNGGTTWKSTYDFAGGHYAGETSFTSPMNGWMAGSSGSLLHTTDGGDSWKKSNVGLSSNLSTVHFRDSLNGWVAGAQGSRFSTNDGGATWQNRTDSSIYMNAITGIRFLNDSYGVIANGAGLWETSDGGSTWKAVETMPVHRDANVNINYLTLTSGGSVWAVGDKNLILYRQGQGTSIAEDVVKERTSFLTVYPNPASGTVQISINASNKGILTLTDALGKELTTIDTQPSENSLTAKFNTADFPSGTYFLQWKSGDTQETIPLVIAR